MIKIESKDKCCGCHACMNICPKGAISMQEDEFGFKYPVVDEKKCINCGLCEKACPIINKKSEEEKSIKAYACINKNEEERVKSSSGGMFILLAKEIINRNGVVFGASFDKDFLVRHSFVEKESDLNKFMGSKYVQSSIDDCYKKAKEYLEKDRYVLFTGTPCQIEGLKTYLGKAYKKLYTQDIICHGVPSPKVLKKYLDYQKSINKEDINSVSFRNKDHSWSLFRTKISFDTRTYSEPLNKDLYMHAFLQNTSLRDSCYKCCFKKKYRVSDITLADYWGVKKIHPEMDDDKGTSLVVINSNKGKELFESIKDNIIYKETDLDKAIPFNTAMTKSVNKDKNRDEFFANLDKMNFDELVKKHTYHQPLYKRLINKAKSIIKKIIKR